MSDLGEFAAGEKMGRSPKDKRILKDSVTENDVWWGDASPNIEMTERCVLRPSGLFFGSSWPRWVA